MLHVLVRTLLLMADGLLFILFIEQQEKNGVVHTTINHSIVKLFITLLSSKIMYMSR
jgi:hypothetical protein